MPQKPVSDIEQSLIDEIRQTGHHKAAAEKRIPV